MTTEQRLIDANLLVDVCKEIAKHEWNKRTSPVSWSDAYEGFIDDVDGMPTVDAVPVVHGRWVWDIETHGDPMYGIDEDYGYRCSECKVWADEYGVDGDIYEEPPTNILHYCPNCGAKMDGGTDNA